MDDDNPYRNTFPTGQQIDAMRQRRWDAVTCDSSDYMPSVVASSFTATMYHAPPPRIHYPSRPRCSYCSLLSSPHAARCAGCGAPL